jgi:hypothetical protein
MCGRWGETPFAVLSGCLAAGIILSTPMAHYCFTGLAVSAVTFIAAAGLSLARNRPELSLACGWMAILIVGLMLGLAERDGFPDTDVRALLARGAIPT